MALNRKAVEEAMLASAGIVCIAASRLGVRRTAIWRLAQHHPWWWQSLHERIHEMFVEKIENVISRRHKRAKA